MRPNVILITIDDLRADHLGFMGYHKNISPNIDKLAKESVVFTNAFSVGPMTPHSLPSILTSTYPLDYQGPKKIERPRVLVSEVLKKQGYTTAVFSANPYLYLGYDKGWDFMEDVKDSHLLFDLSLKKDAGLKLKIKYFLEGLAKLVANFRPELIFKIRYFLYKLGIWQPEKKAKAGSMNKIIKEFVSAVKEEEKPFFCWIHYMDVHYPFLPYDAYFQDRTFSYSELVGRSFSTFLSRRYFFKKPILNFGKKHLKTAINLYDDGIKYVDQQLGDLLGFLEKEDVYRDTVIFLTSDHGEEFLEHGGAAHEAKLYNELLHVPLLVRIPRKQKQRINNKVSLIDLAPTICSLAGAEKESSFKGEDLFQSKREIIFHQTGENLGKIGGESLLDIEEIGHCKAACQSERWKYILDHGSGREELYDLLGDPDEKNNLSKTENKILSQMREKIEEFEKTNPPLALVNELRPTK
jgi:arylsulfatase A-like enzyme